MGVDKLLGNFETLCPALVLIFGGLGLLIAYMIELRMSKKQS